MSTEIEKQKRQAKIDFVKQIPNGFSIIGSTLPNDENDGGEPVTLKVYTQKFDDANKKWVDDEETYEKAKELLTSWGATSVETAAVELFDVIIPEVYVLDGKSRLTPIVPMVQFDWPESNLEKKYFENNSVVVESRPIQESTYKGKERINIYVDAPFKDEVKTYRISQLILEDPTAEQPDQTINLKTSSKEADEYEEDLKEGSIPESAVESVQRSIDNLRKQKRRSVIETLSRKLDVDFEELIQNGGTLTGKVKILQIPNQDKYFPALVVELPTAK